MPSSGRLRMLKQKPYYWLHCLLIRNIEIVYSCVSVDRRDEAKLVEEKRIKRAFVCLAEKRLDLLFHNCPLLCLLDGILVEGHKQCSATVRHL